MTAAAMVDQSKSWAGHDMDDYADDLASLIETLTLQDVSLVGHSTGGGEITRYARPARHEAYRPHAVLLGAIPPQMFKSATNADPGGLADGGLRPHPCRRHCGSFAVLPGSQWPAFYGSDLPGAKVSQGIRDAFWLMGMTCRFEGGRSICIKAFSETDFTEDLKRIDMPMLVVHGDDDQIVPIEGFGRAFVADPQRRDAEGLCGRVARPVLHPQGPGQRRPARLR